MKIKRIILLLFLIYIFSTPVLLSQEVIDQIVAIVGKDIILESELKLQLEIYLAQLGKKAADDNEMAKLRKELLEQMVNDRLLLIQAEQDTLIKINEKEVDQTLEEQLSRIKSQFLTEEAFQEELRTEGLTEIGLKRIYRDKIKEQLLRDKFVNSKFSRVNISSREVREFYEIYRDSLPEQPESVKLSQILLKMEPSQKTLDSLKSFATDISRRALRGEDFSELAKNFSQDLSAKEGGDLGFIKRGEVLPEFEEVAFALNPGETSELVRTLLGYHIIKSEGKNEESVHVRHILIRILPSPSDSSQVLNTADSLYRNLKDGADFVLSVKEYSQDEESKKEGGDIGWFPLAQLPEEIRDKISETEIGQVTSPVITGEGVHILKILDKKEQRRLSLEEDWDELKEMARRKKGGELILKLIEELKERTYVEVRT
ncbi:MAG: peptidylprolyl isomerase [candidate division Zixibacteria bacterium]|nr:peptidylprolyl isomerase [candidate division Zixibacteria bacterium]